MRILTILSGLLMVASGIFLVANEGITVLSVAFVVGIVLAVSGIVECLSYNSYRGSDVQEKTWILIDGTTTFILGCLILIGKLSADAVVPMVLALWVMITGIRNFTRAWERISIKDLTFYEHLMIGVLNVVFGIYVFFDRDIFNLAAITMIGLCLIVQGLNLMLVGDTIVIKKPEFAKTKSEKMEELQANLTEAHLKAKEAIALAKAAKAELKDFEAIPEEHFDRSLTPMPVGEVLPKAGAASENVEEAKEEAKEENKTE